MRLTVFAILTGVLALSMMSVPAYAFSLGPHYVSVQANGTAFSCSSPIGVSGSATGNNILRRPVRITVTNINTGQVVATGTAKVSGGSFSTTVSITDPSTQEGYFTVTASWYGQVAHWDGNFYWAC